MSLSEETEIGPITSANYELMVPEVSDKQLIKVQLISFIWIQICAIHFGHARCCLPTLASLGNGGVDLLLEPSPTCRMAVGH